MSYGHLIGSFCVDRKGEGATHPRSASGGTHNSFMTFQHSFCKGKGKGKRGFV